MNNFQFPISNFKLRQGQVLVLAVMVISGAVLSATAAIGLLMIYELRQAGNIIDSAKAVFAADSGIECGLLKHQEGVGSTRDCGEGAPATFTCASVGVIVIGNGACYRTEDIIDAGNPIGKRSTGRYGDVARSFETYY